MLDLDFAPVFASLDQLLVASMASISIGVIGMIFAMLVGTVGTVVSQLPGRGWRVTVHCYVDLFRGTPLLVQILAFYFIPTALGINISPYVAGIFALTFYYGAYITEIIRGAFEAIPVGHTDAARSLGMKRLRIFWKIQLPQALAVVMSPLAGQFARLFKASSLLSVIGVSELTLRGAYVMTRTLTPIETWLVVAAIYFLFNSIVVFGSIWLERRLVRGRV